MKTASEGEDRSSSRLVLYQRRAESHFFYHREFQTGNLNMVVSWVTASFRSLICNEC